MTTIREAVAADVPRLVEIFGESPEAGNWPEAGLRSSLASPARRCWVAEQDGWVRAVLLVQCPAPGEAEILTLAVERDVRRRGIGRALLMSFLGRESGRVWLEVRESNEAARQLYRHLGFVETGRRRAYYSSPPEDAVVMQLTINQ